MEIHSHCQYWNAVNSYSQHIFSHSYYLRTNMSFHFEVQLAYVFPDKTTRYLASEINQLQRDLLRCPQCNDQVELRTGRTNVRHFAHYTGSECKGGNEGTVHEEMKHRLQRDFDRFTFHYSCQSCKSTSDGIKFDRHLHTSNTNHPVTINHIEDTIDVAILNRTQSNQDRTSIACAIDVCNSMPFAPSKLQILNGYIRNNKHGNSVFAIQYYNIRDAYEKDTKRLVDRTTPWQCPSCFDKYNRSTCTNCKQRELTTSMKRVPCVCSNRQTPPYVCEPCFAMDENGKCERCHLKCANCSVVFERKQTAMFMGRLATQCAECILQTCAHCKKLVLKSNFYGTPDCSDCTQIWQKAQAATNAELRKAEDAKQAEALRVHEESTRARWAVAEEQEKRKYLAEQLRRQNMTQAQKDKQWFIDRDRDYSKEQAAAAARQLVWTQKGEAETAKFKVHPVWTTPQPGLPDLAPTEHKYQEYGCTTENGYFMEKFQPYTGAGVIAREHRIIQWAKMKKAEAEAEAKAKAQAENQIA